MGVSEQYEKRGKESKRVREELREGVRKLREVRVREVRKKMRSPGIEPTWQATIITTRPRTRNQSSHAQAVLFLQI